MSIANAPRPKVTIITPVYNEEENLSTYTSSVRESLLSHPEYDFEVLLIDDGSSDRSWD
jgi:glycosyltransferase involved in cell wall biosynthesis